jgi:Peptidase S24-like
LSLANIHKCQFLRGTGIDLAWGDSLEPEFHDGDIIVINPFLKQEHNDYVVVCNEEGEATFK